MWPALLKYAPVLLVVAGLAGGGWVVRGMYAERSALRQELAVQAEVVDRYAEALERSRETAAATAEALERAHDQIAEIVADRATIMEDLRHAAAPDCPVPDAVRRAVDRLWPSAGGD